MRAWQRRGGQMWSGDGADCSCFTSSLFPFHFISPWMPARGGGGGDKKKSSFILKNGLAPSCTELKAARLKSWQRKGEGGPVPRRAGFGVHHSHPSPHPEPRWGQRGDKGRRASALAPSLPSHQKGSLRAQGARDAAGTPARADREWEPHCHRNGAQGCRHMQAGDRGPQCHRDKDKGGQHVQAGDWRPRWHRDGARGTLTLQKQGAGTPPCAGRGRGTPLP